jgi:hypothetical protein
LRQLNEYSDSAQVPVSVEQVQSAGNLSSAPQADSTSNTSPSITLPTDYARQGEAAGAAQTITNKLDSITSGFSDTGTPKIGDATTAIDNRLKQLNDMPTAAAPAIDLSWLPSLLPGEPTLCRPIVMDMHFTSGQMSGISGSGEVDICDYLDIIRQIFGWIFAMTAIAHIFYVFVRSNKTS